MKITLRILTLLLLNIAFGQTKYTIEKVNVQGYNVQFNPNGNQLLYTSGGLKGLILYDVKAKTTKVISEAAGTGYQPVITDDEIIFRSKGKDNKIEIYNILTGEKTLSSKTPRYHVASQQRNKLTSLLAEPSDDLNSINLVYLNGEKTNIAPLGNRVDYINISLSPSGKKLLFRVSGRGSFISDLKGNIEKELGNVEFPKWINDETVLYTVTEDDGYNYLSSQLFILNLSESSKPEHIETPLAIALYPDYNSALNRIVFNTPTGEIFLVHLD